MNTIKQAAILVVGIPLALLLTGLPLFATYALVKLGGVPGWLALPLGGVLVTVALMILAGSVTVLRNLSAKARQDP